MPAKKKTEKKDKAVKKETKEKPKKEVKVKKETAQKESLKKEPAKKAEAKQDSRKIKGIIFDFWGTIVENGVYPSPIKRVRYILQLNIPFSEYVVEFEESFMTEKFKDLYEGFARVCEKFGIRDDPRTMDVLVGMWNKNKMLAKPYLETVEMLEALKKDYKIALISNTDCFSLRDVMQKFDLEKYFDSVVLSCDVNMLKSNPEMFRKVLDELGLKEDEVLMVGDSIESDIKSAERAGVRALLIDRRNRMEVKDKIMNIREIREFLKKVESE